MPNKKKKYNARFPPARIKKIMQSDDEIGKVAQAVPVIISAPLEKTGPKKYAYRTEQLLTLIIFEPMKAFTPSFTNALLDFESNRFTARALELFVENLLKKAETVTQSRNAKTLTPSHLKQCIMAEKRFDFLKDLVATIPDVQGDEESAMAETPRSSMSNTAFVFPSASATSTNASATSSSSSGTSSPAGRENINSPQEKSASTGGGYNSFYDQRPSVVGIGGGGGAHQSLPMTMPMPNLSKRRISNTIVSSPYGLSPGASTESIQSPGVSGSYQHQLQESVIVTHPNYSEQHNSILNPVGVNSNPYIPSMTVSPHQSNLNMGSQYEYVPNINPNNGINMNTSGIDNSAMNSPLSLSMRNAGSNGGNSGSHPPSGVIVYDNKNLSHYQPQYPSNYDE